jgi:hypothetical protein
MWVPTALPICLFCVGRGWIFSTIVTVGAFVKLRKPATSFVISVCLSVCIEKFNSLWINFYEMWRLRIFLKGKDKVKCTLVHALRLCTGRTARRGSIGIALRFFVHGTRSEWGVSVTTWPLFTPGKDSVPIIQEPWFQTERQKHTSKEFITYAATPPD